jgi:peptide/nickel transport system ATP-binding protein
LPDRDVILSVDHVVVDYGRGRHKVQAVSDVSFEVLAGETFGLVGESGCGKSTLARAILHLPKPTGGRVMFEGHDLAAQNSRALRSVRQRLLMIFQDPTSSLNPRRRVRDIVAEGLAISGRGNKREQAEKVRTALLAVGLDPDAVGARYPREFSGGQCQRIAIARALVLEPKMIICDEPVSSLDVSVQAQIINLLEEMRERYGLSLIFVAHDLAVVKAVSDRVAVMYLGKLCELGPAGAVYNRPLHPYTRALLDAVPEVDPDSAGKATELSGELPSLQNLPIGCRFRTRCPRADAVCEAEDPEFRELLPEHFVACHHPLSFTAISTAEPQSPADIGIP